MSKKKIIFIVFVAILVLAVLFMLLAYDRIKDQYDRNILAHRLLEGIPLSQQTYLFTALDYRIKQVDADYNIDVTYPVFGGQKELDAQILDLVNKQITEFKKVASEDKKARIETGGDAVFTQPSPYTLYISYEKGDVDSNSVSLIFIIDAYSGGAHGMRSYQSFNYYLPGMKPMDLNKVLSHNPDYLKEISKACNEQIAERMAKNYGDASFDKKWLAEGCAAKMENFPNYIVLSNQVKFFIPPYQVAPYVAGSFDFSYYYASELGLPYYFPNIASQYCDIKGGKIETVKIERGEYNLCQLKNGRQCEEWALYNGACRIGGVKTSEFGSEEEKFCAIFGGSVTSDGKTCRLPNGQICSVKDFFAGLCDRGY